jgi:hypothetical protein
MTIDLWRSIRAESSDLDHIACPEALVEHFRNNAQRSISLAWYVDLQANYTLGIVTVGMPQSHFVTAFYVDVSADNATGLHHD